MRHTTENPEPVDGRLEEEHGNPAGEVRLTPLQIGARVSALAGVALGGFIALSPPTISSMK